MNQVTGINTNQVVVGNGMVTFTCGHPITDNQGKIQRILNISACYVVDGYDPLFWNNISVRWDGYAGMFVIEDPRQIRLHRKAGLQNAGFRMTYDFCLRKRGFAGICTWDYDLAKYLLVNEIALSLGRGLTQAYSSK